jgi:hypothetical protein
MARVADQCPGHADNTIATALEGISCEQAAGILGVPVGTLRLRIGRARESVRVQYGRPPARQPRATAKSALPTGPVTVPAAVACNALGLSADAIGGGA